ncbi:hypothetical protein HanHA300_Chr17g0669091 [Helianthus annuus]|nr:hypothetical protein HanHA300_Chr17g0669091 [Helianthus annuus]KAJ0637546.1 hypothetical protein HanOQP8_Chr17g0675161 [Helianthus annuus]
MMKIWSDVFVSSDELQQRSWFCGRGRGQGVVAVSWHVVQQMLADVVVLWQEAAEGKVKYEGYLFEKYGEESCRHRELDRIVVPSSRGKKRGKVYRLSNVKNDFNVQHHGKQDQEVCLFF